MMPQVTPPNAPDVVPALTGHPGRSVAAHLRAHPEDWAHLRGLESPV